MKKPTLFEDIQPVISGGYCVGCGVCAAVASKAVSVARNKDGYCEATILDASKLQALPGGICPFSASAPNEDVHSADLFGANPVSDPYLGRSLSTWAGHVNEGQFREAGSSGGVTSWILVEALRSKLVDAVVHVHAANGMDSGLFAYTVARTVEDVETGAKTRYYSVSMDVVLRQVIDEGLRIALVGVPCFIKAARNLAKVDNKFNDCLVVAVSLICGHMKSAGFAESLAWQLGILPSDLDSVDFRVKRKGYPASQYSFSAVHTKTQLTSMAPMGKMAGRRWDGGYFRLKACDFCDDVVGETADVSLGDAWLPEFNCDSMGTNVLVVRNAKIEALLKSGIEDGRLTLRILSNDEAVATQAGGFRDRRDGLAYRLHLADLSGVWRPQKRVARQSSHLTVMRKLTYRLRQIVRLRSFSSFALSKRLGTIFTYRLEMTFWHGIFRLAGIVEDKLHRKV